VLPAWSPDGGRIAFTSLRDGNPDIYLIDAPPPGQPGDEASVRRLTDHPAGDWRPAWSPDGRRIAFTSTRSQSAGDPASDDNEIFVLTVPLSPEDAPSDLIQLTRNAADDRDPAWQLSGDDIYYLSNAAGNFDVCSMQPDGSGPYCLTDTPYDEYHVATLGDTGRILYSTRQTGRDDVYFMEIAGRYVQRLTGGPDNAGAPAWSPALASPVPLPTPTPALVPLPTLPAGPTLTPAAPAAPPPRPVISVENAGRVEALGHWQLAGAASAAYSPDGRWLAAGGRDRFYLYAAPTLESIGAVAGFFGGVAPLTGTVRSLAWSPDGTLLAVGADSDLQVWYLGDCAAGSASCGRCLYTLAGHAGNVTAVAFSPDGALLASGADGDGTVRVWRAADGSLLHAIDAHTYRLSDLAFSPDGAQLAGASGSAAVRLWQVTGCLDRAPGCGALVDLLTGVILSAEQIDFSPDGATLAVAVSMAVGLWDVSDARLMRTLALPDWASRVAFSPDWSLVASGGSDGRVWLWAPQGDAARVLRQLVGQSDFTQALAFDPTGRTLVSVARDDSVYVWGVEK
jgi:WD40 repeat protein